MRKFGTVLTVLLLGKMSTRYKDFNISEDLSGPDMGKKQPQGGICDKILHVTLKNALTGCLCFK